jgi:DNA polymerase III gamma/tau subunit
VRGRGGEVFTPSAPIDNQALFAGRVNQLNRIIGAVSQRGQHAILFGERGVGKTSLANVLSDGSLIFREGSQIAMKGGYKCRSKSSITVKFFVGED